MCPRAIVIVHVRKEHLAQVPLAKDDDMVKTFPPDRADQPFRMGSDHRLGGRIRLAAQVVGKRSGGVDHHFRGGFKLLAAFHVTDLDGVDEAVAVLDHAGDPRIVQKDGALLTGGGDQVDEQARIVELAVEVEDAAAQADGVEGGKAIQGLRAGKDARGAEAVPARQQVVELETDAVEGGLPPAVGRHYKGQFVNQVGRVPEEQATLLERLHYEQYVALLQVADAAVNQGNVLLVME